MYLIPLNLFILIFLIHFVILLKIYFVCTFMNLLAATISISILQPLPEYYSKIIH